MNIQLPEIVAIGIYDTKIALKNVSVTKTRKTTMFEIEIPIANGGISHINDERMPISPDMIICAKPGQIRHTKTPYKCYYIHMILERGDLYDSLMSLQNYIKTSKFSKYLEIFKKMCEYYETALERDEIMLQSLILKLIYMLIDDSKSLEIQGNVKQSNYKTIEKVIKYIKDNITADLSLETVAKYAGFSPIHFHNCFKASTGMTLREYVEEQRIKRAINILVSTDKSLTDIAYECGFSSQSYFSFAFKRKMKMTPREYVKQVLSRYDI